MSLAPRRSAQSRFETLRGLRLHALAYEGQAERPLRVLLHGWMDLAASFQFLVDAFADPAPVLALDWRGFGHSEAGGHDAYFFADYLGDLDAWLDRVSPGRPVDLIAHSMGGNVAMLYAGVRPDRVRRLVNLEGFGLPDSSADEAPQRLQRWLDEAPPGTPFTELFLPYPAAQMEAFAVSKRVNSPANEGSELIEPVQI